MFLLGLLSDPGVFDVDCSCQDAVFVGLLLDEIIFLILQQLLNSLPLLLPLLSLPRLLLLPLLVSVILTLSSTNHSFLRVMFWVI